MKERSLHRSITSTGTAGPVGAAYSVDERNWKCKACKAENFAKRQRCFRCKAKKSAAGGGLVQHNGMVSASTGVDHNWREALDPKTQQLYYYNTETQAVQWDRPAEMGTAPMATGWYGRGVAGSNAQVKLDKLNEEYLKRPAPKQAENLATNNVAYKEGSQDYNIWYGKFAGDSWNNDQSYEPADARCKVKLHAGYTQADKKFQDKAYWCMWWARGKCAKGSRCRNFHRIPTYADCGRLEKDLLHDLFGRERHANQRDDMSGVGSFNESCRTLYVGRLQRSKYMDNPKQLNNTLTKHFSEWGEVEHLNVIWRLSIAFVRYRFRSHAELAKIAMQQQALDGDEVLVIRWAYADPNPVAKEAIKRSNADAVVAAIKASGHTLKSVGYQLPADYKPPELANGEESTGDKPIGPAYYPNTDAQYQKAKKQKTEES